MRTVYKVTRWNSATAMEAASFSRHYRAPAARDALYQAVYDMLAANGLLDREIAWNLRQQCIDCEVSPPPAGHSRRQTFRLDYDNHVTFEAVRE